MGRLLISANLAIFINGVIPPQVVRSGSRKSTPLTLIRLFTSASVCKFSPAAMGIFPKDLK